jgi:hypothetical protein
MVWPRLSRHEHELGDDTVNDGDALIGQICDDPQEVQRLQEQNKRVFKSTHYLNVSSLCCWNLLFYFCPISPWHGSNFRQPTIYGQDLWGRVSQEQPSGTFSVAENIQTLAAKCIFYRKVFFIQVQIIVTRALSCSH